MGSFKIRQDEIDKGIYLTIQKELVIRGLLPDVFTFNVGTALGNEAYNDALKALPYVVELFSVGSAKSRGQKETSAIVIDRDTPRPAASGVGKDLEYDYNEDTGKYDKSKLSDTKYDIPYTITYFTNRKNIADEIEDVIRTAIGERAYLNSVDLNRVVTGEFYFMRSGDFNTSGKDFIERGVNYTARNIDLIGGKSMGDIAPFDFNQFELGLAMDTETSGYQLVEMINLSIVNIGGLILDLAGIDTYGDVWYNTSLNKVEVRDDGDIWAEVPSNDPTAELYIDTYGDLYLFTDD